MFPSTPFAPSWVLVISATFASAAHAATPASWHDDYLQGYKLARAEQKMLLINFVPPGNSAMQRNLDALIASSPAVQQQLRELVLVRVPTDVAVTTERGSSRLLSHPGFASMQGQAGLAIIDLKHSDPQLRGQLVSAFPFSGGKYYRWQAGYLPTVLALPKGTLTQRTMVWAVRTHPERPASAHGAPHPLLCSAACSHCQHQARIGVQGHHSFSSRQQQLSGQIGAGSMSEVVAESWPGQTMIDSCVDCVQSWRQSPGHWGEVRRSHAMYGYDIRRGPNGIWYATGIFSN